MVFLDLKCCFFYCQHVNLIKIYKVYRADRVDIALIYIFWGHTGNKIFK